MPCHMVVQVTALHKGHGTDAAAKWSLARVKAHMRLEAAFLREALRAVVAQERPLACVDAPVCYEIGWFVGRIITLVAVLEEPLQ